MNYLAAIKALALAAPLLPAAAFFALGLVMLIRRSPNEAAVARLVSTSFSFSLVCSLCVASWVVVHGQQPVVIELGTWFHADGYGFEASLLVDRLSVPMMAITAALCGLIGRFSGTYLVGEPGHARFYLLLSLFASGMLLLVMAGSLDLLIAGWELVGLSSMLLIAFFHERSYPVRNALRAFVVYRTCDVGLLVSVVLMHHYFGTGDFEHALGAAWPSAGRPVPFEGASLLGLCLLLAASGKSALFPMGSWLPRAMEGPTPSSAIFYGALSVHAGAYLMLRMYPLIDEAPLARTAIVVVGALTALHGTLAERVQSDVKSQLAYATTTQIGVIFAEIGLGFPRLALLHLVSHALVRTLQLLRAPNAIQDMMLIRAGAGADHVATGSQFAPIEHSRVARWLYHLSLERFHLDKFWERTVARPLIHAARGIEAFEAGWLDYLAGKSKHTPKDPFRPMSASEKRTLP